MGAAAPVFALFGSQISRRLSTGLTHGALRRLHFLQPRQGQAHRCRAAIGGAEARKTLVPAPGAAGRNVRLDLSFAETHFPVRNVIAVVPGSGAFTIYLNTTVLNDTYLSWFVLN